MSSPFFVAKDSRGRLALGSVLKDDQYIVRATSGGAIILEPAVIMTKQDYELARQPALLEQIKAALADPDDRVTDED